MNKKGFSLVELLVACAILSILLVLLAQMMWWVSGISASGSARNDRRERARALREAITRELQAAALPVDRRVASGRGDLQFVINPASVPAKFKNAHTIFWQAPLATDSSEGAMAEIGYFVRWRDNRAMLCRLFLNPAESRTLLGGDDQWQRVYQYPGNWVNEAVLEAAAPADKASGYRGLFAENVIGFWARAFDDKRVGIFNAGSNSFNSNINSGGNTAPALPTSIEITYVTLDASAANRLADHPQAVTLVGVIQSLAADSDTKKTDELPSTKFLNALAQKADLKFLMQGIEQRQMLIKLK